MSRATPDPTSEKTVSHKRFMNRINQSRSSILDLSNSITKRGKHCISNSARIKKIQISMISRNGLVEAESVGEEGTAQLIRSPIVKRNKSSSQSVDLLNPLESKIGKTPKNEVISSLSMENKSLKQQIDFYKEQLKVYQKTISDMSMKYELAKTENIDLEEKMTQILIENRKFSEENEKLINMLRFLESRNGSVANKEFIQEALEAKILSIDQDRDEKLEKYKKILKKYIVTLQDYLKTQEWVLSLVTSPYPKKEIIDAEDSLKEIIEKVQIEIIYYQSQLNNEKTIEKSYCTSMSSSVLYSPQYSPTKAIRFTNIQEFLSPSQI